MMSHHAAAFPQKQVPIRSTHEAIEQAVSVNVAQLFSTKEETDSPIAMHTKVHVGEPFHLHFHGTDRA